MNTTTSIDLATLDKLEALARAAKERTAPETMMALACSLDAEIILALIELARRASPISTDAAAQPEAWKVGLEVFRSHYQAVAAIRNPDLKPIPLYAAPAHDAAAKTEQAPDDDAIEQAISLLEAIYIDRDISKGTRYLIAQIRNLIAGAISASAAGAGSEQAPVACYGASRPGEMCPCSKCAAWRERVAKTMGDAAPSSSASEQELPEPFGFIETAPGATEAVYSADQMREARAAHQAATTEKPYCWHYKSMSGVSVFHTEKNARLEADMKAAKDFPGTHSVTELFAHQAATNPPSASIAKDHQFLDLLRAHQAAELACDQDGSDNNREASNEAWEALISYLDHRPPASAQPVAAAPADAKPCGWLVGGGDDCGEVMYWRLEAAQRDCDQHNAYERSRGDFDPADLRAPEPVYRAAPAAPVAQATTASVQPTVCPLPPSGWHCTRDPGHDGPCAAWSEGGAQ